MWLYLFLYQNSFYVTKLDCALSSLLLYSTGMNAYCTCCLSVTGKKVNTNITVRLVPMFTMTTTCEFEAAWHAFTSMHFAPCMRACMSV
jgi:hypothetical protein